MKNPYQTYDEYGLRHVPTHLIGLEQWDTLGEFLTDLYFIEAKCAAGMTYELVTDYNTALDELPNSREENQKKRVYEARLDKYIKDLIQYAKGKLQTFEVIPSVKPWTNEKIRIHTQDIINRPNIINKIKSFYSYVFTESHSLNDFGTIPSFCIQHAHNSVKSGPVTEEAEKILKNVTSDIILTRLPSKRPEFHLYPALKKSLEGHSGFINTAKISYDGKRAITGSTDNTLRFWDIETGTCIHILRGHANHIADVAITPDSYTAISGGVYDYILRVWDLKNGKCVKELASPKNDTISCVCISSDGKKAISGNGNLYGGASKGENIYAWNIEKGELICSLDGHKPGVLCINMDPVANFAISGGMDGTVKLWDINNKKCLVSTQGLGKTITSLSATPDLKKVVFSLLYTEIFLVLDIDNWEWIELKGHKRPVTCVAITHDGKRVISGSEDGSLLIWDIENRNCIKRFTGHMNSISCLSMTPDGKTAISGSGEHIDDGEGYSETHENLARLWDIEHGESHSAIEAIMDDEARVFVDAGFDGKKAVFTKENSQVQILDTEKGEHIKNLNINDANGAIFTPDGKKLISWGFSDGQILKTIDIETGEDLNQFHTLKKNSISIARVSSNEKLVALGCHANCLQVGCLSTGKMKRLYKFERTKTKEEEKKGGFFLTMDHIQDICISNDGIFAVTGHFGGEIRVWDIQKGECIQTLKGIDDKPVLSVDISPDQKIIASASRNKTFSIWNLRTGEHLRIYREHKKSVESIYITPDGKNIVTASTDMTLRVWNLRTGNCLAVFQAGRPISHVSKIVGDKNLAIATYTNEIIFIKHNNLSSYNIVTPVRMWIYNGYRNWLSSKILRGKGDQEGYWEEDIKATCCECVQRFTVPNRIIEAIESICHEFQFSSENSPCLELPYEVWNDKRLVSKCPNCQNKIQFNPYYVDNRQ